MDNRGIRVHARSFAAIILAITPLSAQVFTFTKEQMIRYTEKNPFERFEDGRPKVPDAILEKCKGLSAEEVWAVLREFHAALGPLVNRFEGTLDHFSGDGLMVYFNDPLPCPDPAERAVRMAVAMREAVGGLMAGWRRRGFAIGFGIGVAQGYATLGRIGFEERVDYTAIGTVTNLAARLCAEAQDGQILLSKRVAAAVEGIVILEEVGNLALKGLSQAIAVYNVVGEVAG